MNDPAQPGAASKGTPPTMPMNRRDFSVRLAGYLAVAGLASARGADAPATPGSMPGDAEVSSNHEAIHQEETFQASPARVYDMLTDPKKFDRIVELSGAKKEMPAGAPPTTISPEVGGTFTLFGGIISGRLIEMTPGVRLVQAWRVVNWPPGIYSIARFELVAQGDGTKLIFDHSGFPEGKGAHLASGWKAHYWGPMTTYLSQAGAA